MEMWFDHSGVDERGIHRKRALPPKADSSLAIDLTPMLDVVMIMLIFFIVAGSFVHEVVVDVERKKTSSAAPRYKAFTISTRCRWPTDRSAPPSASRPS